MTEKRLEKIRQRRQAKEEKQAQADLEKKKAEEQQKKEDIRYMRQALTQAKKAMALGETPIGCVIVYEGKVIGRGYNRRNTDKSTLSHAEITAIRKASKVLGDWRLEGCRLYVTLEPCQMCAGAIVQARIPQVVIGAMNPKAGCAGSVLNLFQIEQFNHQVEVTYDVCKDECSKMLKDFFQGLRRRLKTEKE
ncbi:MAG: tRNA adenosine(34) deaminase TadA [Parasporobacterium sp.]|nr:tRNA adenosine(34) deaminase TadA [Parasporobacterium sp.]MBR6316350.1 tRNA adenosine(34) deaminase TadA [Lachnospiraceae bacterium]